MSMLNLQQIAPIPMANSKPQILVLNQQKNTILTSEFFFNDCYEVTKASSINEGFKLLKEKLFSLVILENYSCLLGMEHLILAIREMKDYTSIPIMIILKQKNEPLKITTDYTMKHIYQIPAPVSPNKLHTSIEKIFQSHGIKETNLAWQYPNLAYPSLSYRTPEQFELNRSTKTTQILDSISEAYIATDRDWRVIYYNKAAIGLFDSRIYKNGKINFTGDTLWDLLAFDVKDQISDCLQEAMLKSKSMDKEISVYGNWLKIRANPIDDGLSIYCTDITEQKKLKEELVKLERLKLIAQMAAGITHEVRNPITVVRAVLDLALLAGKPISEEKIYMMIQEIDRANSIISEFLALSSNSHYQKELIALDQIVNNLVPLIEAKVINSNKELKLKIEKCKPIYFCPSKINQLILNLVFNGLEAMEHQGDTLTVETYQKQETTYLKISDEGTGISMNDLQNIWNPFFTTKEDGTGLGLAICNTIVTNHNGIIDVETNSNGTTFIVHFHAYSSKGN